MGSKRAPFPREVEYAKSFVKDWDRLSRAGRRDLGRLKAVMLQLVANDAPLGAEWKDHPLKGDWADHRECHIGGDFLLIYQTIEKAGRNGVVVFVRAGSHNELFNE